MTLDEYVSSRAAEEAAKRRSEPKRVRAKNTSGLVIYPPIRVSATGATFNGTQLHPQELRFSLLFWDKLDYPSNNLVEAGPGADAEFLISAGVLQRTHVQMIGEFSGGDVFRLPFLRTLEMLDEKEPGTWSVATGERSISFLDSELESGRGALVGLYRAIPVPDKDVHLDDLLNFKRKRNSELLALRHHLETIYARVANAEDGDLALVSETAALEQAASNHIKAAKGMGLKWRLADLTASVSFSKGAAVALAGHTAGLSMVSSLVTGGIASLDVKVGAGLSRARSAETPFRYVSSYHKELFPLS